MVNKIILIKLGAKGDVIRTLPLAKALKEKYPDSEISWITRENVRKLVEYSEYINRVLPYPYEPNGKFDILYNFDIDKEATDLARKIQAKEKYGFYEEGGFVLAFNFGAEYYLNTIFDDETKKKNRKTYQEMMFEAAELSYKIENSRIKIKEEDLAYGLEFLKKNDLNSEKLIGIHIGSSPRWPSKVWHKDRIIEFISKLDEKGYSCLIFSGPNEIENQKNLLYELGKKNVKAYVNEANNSDGEFAGLINICKVVVCSDSFALHVSVLLKKPTIGLFFCTSPDEVEGYGILKKIVSPNLKEYFPEKMDSYSEKLTKSITADEVLEALEEIISLNKTADKN